VEHLLALGDDLEAALAWLDSHANFEKGATVNDPTGARIVAGRRFDPPSLDRMRRLVAYLGDPQLDLDIVHITGTNGKGSVARMVTQLLRASGRSTGTYTSPHLEHVRERIALGGEAIPDPELAKALADTALAEAAAGVEASWFELVTAAAFRAFNDAAVEAAVVEVGMGGRWDATNVADGAVAVITNIGLDHTEFFGPTKQHVAREKAGLIKPGAVSLLGEVDDPEIVDLLRSLAQEQGAGEIWQRGRDFHCDRNRLAIAGRALTLRTPGRTYADVFIPLHGPHQGDNAAIALAAAEAFIGTPLDDDVVAQGFAASSHPGRLEVLGRRPLVLLDGAHNAEGAAVLAASIEEAFPVGDGRRMVVMGLLEGRDPAAMLAPLARNVSALIAVAPPSPRAMDPANVAAAAREVGIASVAAADRLDRALEDAYGRLGPDDQLLVTGSLYLVGSVRSHLMRLTGTAAVSRPRRARPAPADPAADR
jgi:dihydrofolate synthase/folylpolyglutamate synthase